jgi:hypothetical protein
MSGKEKISRYFFHHPAEIPCIYYTFLRSATRIPGPIKPVDRTNKLFGVPLQLHALLLPNYPSQQSLLFTSASNHQRLLKFY